jgi:hypothetical protein
MMGRDSMAVMNPVIGPVAGPVIFLKKLQLLLRRKGASNYLTFRLCAVVSDNV